jgi:type II secretory pathway component PulF
MAVRLGLKTLAGLSRQLGTMLDAGLPIRRALGVIEKSARPPAKGIYRRVGIAIEQGETLSQALEHEGRAFPLLYTRLVHMGEVVGGLDKVFIRLADYYDFIRSVWMRLITRLVYPVFQYWALIGILSGLAYIRSMILPGGNGSPRAALTTLGTGVVIFFAPIIAYFLLTRSLSGSRVAHEVLLRIPVVGRVISTLALARFCWSMELMTDSGVNIYNALQWSMDATANGAFEARTPAIIQRIKDGLPLSQSLDMSGLFPHDCIEMIAVAEESGSLPDTFKRLARNYFEQADMALRALVTAFSWLIWIGVASVIIYYIFTMAMTYIGALNGLLTEVGQ